MSMWYYDRTIWSESDHRGVFMLLREVPSKAPAEYNNKCAFYVRRVAVRGVLRKQKSLA